MASTKRQENASGGGQLIGLPFVVNDQYVKDISFENINYMLKFQGTPPQPQVSVDVETNAVGIDDVHFEVIMKISARSFVDETDIFVLEMLYGAIITVDRSLSDEVVEAILYTHCPYLMFPFIRYIVSDVISSGGYPPLLLDPIDFASLYIEKKRAMQEKADSEENAADGNRISDG
jgi:preprotein translocase subunit SecB